MNRTDFDKYLEGRRAIQLDIRIKKGKAYAGTGDVFANFKRNAERVGVSKYQIWLVYFNKHIDSITNAIKQQPENPVDESEGLAGRIDDAKNYLDLLAGMLEEDRILATLPMPAAHDGNKDSAAR